MKGKALFSQVQEDGTLVLYLEESDTGAPGPDDVILRIDATPVNPSDLALLVASADLNTLKSGATANGPVVQASIPREQLAALGGRIGVPMAVGNEGAGVVVAAGERAVHLIGKTVACMGRTMYSQYARVPASICHVLPDGLTAAQGAAALVNPLTALAMIDTMRAEGHSALVHTAAASSLGQMLNRVCLNDNVPLINIVRQREQAELLHGQGAQSVCVSSDEDFGRQLVEALVRTRATMAFDAIGGGPLIDQLLDAIETIELRHVKQFSRYGSLVRKTIYVYGKLDERPIEFQRRFDFAWNVSGWLLPLTRERMRELWVRISSELTTTFATDFGTRLSLDELLVPSNLIRCAQRATGQKFLITPNAHSV